jgi:hypothetical protein
MNEKYHYIGKRVFKVTFKLCTDLSEAKSIFIYFYARSPDAAAWMLKFVFVCLTNTMEQMKDICRGSVGQLE